MNRALILLLVAVALIRCTPVGAQPSDVKNPNVPALTIFTGTVTGKGMRGDGLWWLIVDGQSRSMADGQGHYSGIDFGDEVTLACSNGHCWLFAFKKRAQ